ncbi:MAG: periplasmic heavy metal sensor [Deltaproteobacteria bacterium]|nr:periplasmic heavy metal sensor [Deltaproteobacteria bacterium]
MKKTIFVSPWAVTVFFLAYILMGVPIGEAMKKHHQSGVTEKASASTPSSDSGMMKGAKGGGMGMKDMMAGPDEGNGQGMMGMMDQGMMRMMMSHMMGGPGGMGKMMGQMGSGMKGPGGGPRGMAQMVRMLEDLNLTPEQWDQVRTQARAALDKMVDLWAQRMKLKIELAGLNWDEKTDPQQVKDLFVKTAEAKAEMLLACLQYLRELKETLTPEQLKTLEDQGL